MREKYKYLIKNIGFFTIAGFVPKVLSFLMIPIYTRCLSTASYGTAELLNSTVQLLMPLLTLQVQDAVLRYSLDQTYRKSEVLSVGIQISICGGILLTAALFIVRLTNAFPLGLAYGGFLLVNYFTGALNNIFSYFCRGIDKVKVLTLGSVLCSLITIGCNLLFLVKFRWGLNGYLLANSVGAFCCAIYVFFGAELYRYTVKVSFHSKAAKEMIVFSAPMIFSALAWWVNNASDKYFVTFFRGVSLTGIYSVSYKIPIILMALGDVVSKAFSISAIRDFDETDRDGFIGTTYSAISFCMTVGCSAIMLLNIPLARLLFAKRFFIAWRFVPPLLVSVLFNQLSLSCENIFLAVRRTKIISVTAVIGAAVNIGCNFLLIPKFGAYGAAIATVISFGLVWLLRYRAAKKYITMQNAQTKELLSYVLIIAQMILAYWKMKLIIPQIIIFIAILLLYGKEAVQAIRKLKVRFSFAKG